MPHFSDLASIRLERPSIVTIGVFDGVHRGHQLLIRSLVDAARARDSLAVVITFFPHPDVFLKALTGRFYLTTPEDRAQLLMQMGVDYVYTLPFDDALRRIRAADFVERLLEHLHMEALWVGSDFALGYKREGDVAYLQRIGAERGFSLHVVDLLPDQGRAISSTAIREALAIGQVEEARELLGRPYHVSGEVVHGLARGRIIGFPTANIAVWDELIIPANGVYAGWASLDGEPEPYMAVTNVGVRPTFDGHGVTVEVHLLDFDRDIYGRTLTFTFEKRLRFEQRFSDVDALIAQIRADAAAARDFLTMQRAVNPDRL
jgi:riboflavin kinase/FMN adenylyltransferase